MKKEPNDNPKGKAESDILEKLLANVTAENKHGEIDFGQRISNEKLKRSPVKVMMIEGMRYKIVGQRRPAKYKSKLFAAFHKTAVDFYRGGLIDAKSMNEYDESCLGIEWRKMNKKTADKYKLVDKE